MKEFLDTAGVTGNELGANGPVIADTKFAPASKPLSSSVKSEPKSLVTIKTNTFIPSVARTSDNMQRRTSRYCMSWIKVGNRNDFFFIFCGTMFEFCKYDRT